MTILTVGPTSAYQTIQAAMAAAFPGDTIMLQAGYSNEIATITQDNITIDAGASSSGIHLHLEPGVANLHLAGTAAINVLDAGSGNVISGNAGDNLITVTGGTDHVDGGLGDDRLVIDYHSATAAMNGSSDSGFAAADAGLVTVTAGTIEHFTILAGSGINTLTTGAGDDRIETAGASANTIAAGDGDNTVITGAGADTITVGGGRDIIMAGDGANTITGLGGDKIITAAAGADTITFTTGNNTVHAGAGANTITGTSGNSKIWAGDGADTITLTSGHNVIRAESGANTITATSGNNIITAGAGADTVTVTSGNNATCVGDGANTVTATSGNNTIVTGSGADTITVTSGNNTIHAGDGANTITATSGHNTIISGNGADTIATTDGGNYIAAGNGANTIATGAGDDTIITGVDIDTVDAGAGDDSITINGGTDGIAGGAGSDVLIVDFSAATGPVVISALAGTYSAGYAGNVSGLGVATFAGIETFNLRSGSGDDWLATGGGDDTIDAGAGQDHVAAGAGSDLILGGIGDVIDGGEGGSDLDTLNLHGLGPYEIVYDPLSGENGTVYRLDTQGQRTTESLSFSNIEQITDIAVEVAPPPAPTHLSVVEDTASALDLSSLTVSNSDCCEDLTVVVSATAGTLNAESHDGVTVSNSGSDAISLTGAAEDIDNYLNAMTNILYTGALDAVGDAAAAVTVTADDCDGAVTLGSFTVNITPTDHPPEDTPINDVFSGTEGPDTVLGGAGNDLLLGNDGDDTLAGGPGDDTLYGGNGTDSLLGGDGDDLLVSGGTDCVVMVVIEGPSWSPCADLQGNDTLIGGAGNDTLLGNFGAESLDGGSGDDMMAGGPGDDTYSVESAGDTVTEDAYGGLDTVLTTLASYTLGANLETLVAMGMAGFTGTGNTQDNTLIGSAGNDSLDGGLGADTMRGGLGDDTYHVDSGNDLVVELYNGGFDTVVTSVSYTLGDNIESLILIGSAALDATGSASDNLLVGNNGSNHLWGMRGDDTLLGADGADTLDGGAGDDNVQGGTGNDTYYVDSLGDVLTEQTASGTDTVIAVVDWTLGSNFETLILDGADNLNGIGNTADNLIYGNTGDNALFGMAGNDTLTGGGGNDTLDGGLGADTMKGGNGDDTYVVDTTFDSVTEAAYGGTDAVLSSVSLTLAANVENLTLTGQAAINAIGNAAGNLLIGNTADNLLSGLAGRDTMIGGLGNDSYIVDSGFDVLFEFADEGTDLVTSSVNWTLGSGFEDLMLSGSTASSGTGNAQANAITGNGAANRLLGLAGDDSLTGNAGNDTLTGGAGADHFVFTMANGNGVDTITDFSALSGGADQGDVFEFNGLLIGTFAYMGDAAFSGGSDNSEARFVGTRVQVDVNGDGTADILITVSGLTNAGQLSTMDFMWS